MRDALTLEKDPPASLRALVVGELPRQSAVAGSVITRLSVKRHRDRSTLWLD